MNTEENNQNLPFKSLQILPKSGILAKDLERKILDGEVNPLEVKVFLKKVMAIDKKVFTDSENKEQLNDLLEQEFLKCKEGKNVKMYNATIGETNREYYDFKECGDDLWDDLDHIEKQVKQLKKDREDQLKKLHPDNQPKQSFGIPSTKIMTDYTVKLVTEETTEVFEINPPLKRTVTSLRFTL